MSSEKMSSEKVTLKVVTPLGAALEESVDEVVLQGDLGEFGVLAGHAHLISGVAAGEIRYAGSEGEKRFAISGGVAEVTGDTVTVLADAAEISDKSGSDPSSK